MQPRQWWAEYTPPPWLELGNVSEILGATLVAPVAPVDTSLNVSY